MLQSVLVTCHKIELLICFCSRPLRWRLSLSPATGVREVRGGRRRTSRAPLRVAHGVGLCVRPRRQRAHRSRCRSRAQQWARRWRRCVQQWRRSRGERWRVWSTRRTLWRASPRRTSRRPFRCSTTGCMRSSNSDRYSALFLLLLNLLCCFL